MVSFGSSHNVGVVWGGNGFKVAIQNRITNGWRLNGTLGITSEIELTPSRVVGVNEL